MQGMSFAPSIAGAAASVILNGVVILIATNIRASIHALRSEMDAKFASSALEIYQRINGTYVRAEAHTDLKERVSRLEDVADSGR